MCSSALLVKVFHFIIVVAGVDASTVGITLTSKVTDTPTSLNPTTSSASASLSLASSDSSDQHISRYYDVTSLSTQEAVTETHTSFSTDSETEVNSTILTSANGSSSAATSAMTSSAHMTTVLPTTEFILNTSAVFDSYWVKTVILVSNQSTSITSSSFVATMEYRLATVYSLAMQTQAGTLTTNRRRKRAVTYENATIQMTNTTREYTSPTNVDLIYYLVQYDVINATATSAQSTCALMNLIPLQEVTLMLGYVVVTQCEVYIPPPPSYLWVIGAVIGGIFGLLFLIWFIMFCYFKCTRPPKRFPKRTPGANSSNRVTDVTDFEQQVVEHDFTDVIIKGQVNVPKTSSSPSPKKKKKRRKRKTAQLPVVMDTETTVDSDQPQSSDIYFVECHDSTTAGNDSIISDDSIASRRESFTGTPPLVHTPMYLDRTCTHPVITPWNPYVAGDLSAQIFSSSSPPADISRNDSNDSGTELSVSESPNINKGSELTTVTSQRHHGVKDIAITTDSEQRHRRDPPPPAWPRDSGTDQSDYVEYSGARPVSMADLIRYEHQQLFTPVVKPTNQ